MRSHEDSQRRDSADSATPFAAHFSPGKVHLKDRSAFIKASLTNGDWTGERVHYSEQEVTLEIDPTLLPPGNEDLTTDVVITLQGEHPFEVRVPIIISRG